MKKILIVAVLLSISASAWSIESKEIEEIIQGITGPGNKTAKKNIVPGQNNTGYPQINKNTSPASDEKKEKTKTMSFPSPDEALLKSGIELFEASLYSNSKQKFEELRTKYPESPYRDNSSIWLSRINIEQTNYDEAVKALNTVGQDSGEYPSALYYIGEINLRKGDDTGAIEYFYRVTALFPDHELADDALIHIAKLYIKNNKGNQALEASIKVIKNYESRETIDDAYFILAQVFERDALLKDFGVSRKIYKIFIKKAEVEKAPFFNNSPLLERAKNNLHNIENTYYSKGFNN